MEIACSLLLLFLIATAFFANVHQDFNGKKGSPPNGFRGFITTCIAVALLFGSALGAGAFDSLITQLITLLK